ncbi:ribokinase [Augochlora pura]
MSPKVVVVGSCMIDFTCYSPRLPKPGETIIGKSFEIKYGGKGANQCIAAAKLGASTAMVACLGSDIYAQEYLKIFEKENVNINHVQIQKDQHSGVAHIIVDDNGQNSIVIILGSNTALNEKQVDTAVEIVRDADVLLCQLESSLEGTRHALRLHKGHGLSILNGAPAMEHIDEELLSLCDIFCLNETEAEVMTGVQTIGLTNVQKIIDKLLDYGCNTVVLTLGELGAAFASKECRNVTVIPNAKNVQPVDTTGAGDAFLGAIAYFKAYHPELPMNECIRRACAIATESVLKLGTHNSFPTRDNLSPELFV